MNNDHFCPYVDFSIKHSAFRIDDFGVFARHTEPKVWTLDNKYTLVHSLTHKTHWTCFDKKKNGIKSTRPISARTLYQKSKKENGKNTKILLIKFTILFITLLNALFLYWLFIISYFSLDNVGWALSLRAYEYFNVSGNKSPLD